MVLTSAFLLFFNSGRKQQQIPNPIEFTAAKHILTKLKRKRGIHQCNVCTKLISGFFSSNAKECTICGMKVHAMCSLRHKPRCKSIVTPSEQPHKHQWLEHQIENVPCSACFSLCSPLFGTSQTCLWCHRTIHKDCLKDLASTEICDCGSLADAIILPTEVTYNPGRQSSQKDEENDEEQDEQHQYLNNTTHGIKKKKKRFPQSFFERFISLFKSKKQQKQKRSNKQQSENSSQSDSEPETNFLKQKNSEWTFQVNPKKSPVVVVINKKSGGQMGQAYMAQLFRYLNPIQVIDLIDEGLDKLKLFEGLANLKIIVGGGDGTVASVVNYMKSGAIPSWVSNSPPVAVLPLGTGNDLARCLGWGGGSEGPDSVFDYLLKVSTQGQPILLDRWKLQASKGMMKGETETMIFNYFSIGLDARTCLNFHRLREKFPQLFFSRIGNKLIYSQIGAADMLSKKKQNLNEICEVTVDGNPLEIPNDIQNIIFLNITSWAGGATRLWEISPNEVQAKVWKPQSLLDRRIEVIGLTSLLHLGQVQTGLDAPVKLAQGENISLRIIEKVQPQALQIDGEPFEVVGPMEFTISHADQANMMTHQQQKSLQQEAKILSVLTWALEQEHINVQQKDILLNRFLENSA